MWKWLLIVILVPATWATSWASGQQPTPLVVKQVAAPPSDITAGVVTLPDPVDLGIASRSALLAVNTPEGHNGRWAWSIDLPIGPDGGRAVFLPGSDDAWSIRAVSPDGLDLDPRQLPEIPGLSHRAESLAWMGGDRLHDALLIDGVHRGTWRIEIESDRPTDGPVSGYVLLGLNPEKALYTHRASLSAIKGQPVTLVSSFTDGPPFTDLRAFVRSPSGEHSEIIGKPGATEITFVPDESGSYAVRVVAEGIDADGDPLILTTQHLIDVALPAAPLGQPLVDRDHARVVFRFDPQPSYRRVILAAEVWGSRDGEMVAVCWLARICGQSRSLALDPRWIAMAGVDPGTLELRQTRIHDVDTMTLLELRDRTPVPIAGLELPQAPTAIADDMLVSPSPEPVMTPMDSGRGLLPPGHRLLFVHGYCADGNPFPTNHFSGSYTAFNNPGANQSHDEFALEILAQTAQMKSFGVAAHSQGGLATLHLYNFYFSPMDWARGDRLIQSVGSPYQGTPLAGNAAVLGDLFGSGCGENADLTPSGAAQWLATIPTASRQQVWYWRTAFEDRPFAFDYCNIVTDLFLSDPEDGVVESSRGILPGANDMGLREGWCHTDEMRDPQQTTDASRNTEINARARR